MKGHICPWCGRLRGDRHEPHNTIQCRACLVMDIEALQARVTELEGERDAVLNLEAECHRGGLLQVGMELNGLTKENATLQRDLEALKAVAEAARALSAKPQTSGWRQICAGLDEALAALPAERREG